MLESAAGGTGKCLLNISPSSPLSTSFFKATTLGLCRACSPTSVRAPFFFASAVISSASRSSELEGHLAEDLGYHRIMGHVLLEQYLIRGSG